VKVLVGYASALGSTREIAQAIGTRLVGAGVDTDVRTVDEIDTVDGYDAVVLGSAIHNMVWLPAAVAFVRRHAGALTVRPLWLFSVSSVGETSSFFGPRVGRWMRRMRHEPREMVDLRESVRPRGHRDFAGAVHRGDWGRGGGVFLRAFGGHYGDHRDWRDIDAWADGIARALAGTGNPASA
jgi:menaquinone-dependent protoporphyrinogen oxidase